MEPKKVTYASFVWTRRKEEWQGTIFTPLLLRHGPPPPGVKWYGKQNPEQRVHLTDHEARQYVKEVVDDIYLAICNANSMSHYHEMYLLKLAKHVKNHFLKWCRENDE